MDTRVWAAAAAAATAVDIAHRLVPCLSLDGGYYIRADFITSSIYSFVIRFRFNNTSFGFYYYYYYYVCLLGSNFVKQRLTVVTYFYYFTYFIIIITRTLGSKDPRD